MIQSMNIMQWVSSRQYSECRHYRMMTFVVLDVVVDGIGPWMGWSVDDDGGDFLVILASPDPLFTKKNYQNYQLYSNFM
jgi:hypothetical protein